MKKILTLIAISGTLATTAEMPRFAVSLARTSDGIVWAGTDGDGLWKSDDCGKTWQRDKTYDEVGGDCSFCLCVDSSGRLWSGSLEKGVCVYNGSECHKNQCERKNGFEFEDAFSVSEVKRALKIGADDEYLVITDDDGVIAAARLLCERLIDEEFQNSVDYYAMNHDYREWKAKQRVGFREAYKYHCTYERFGASSPPIIKVPKVTLNN